MTTTPIRTSAENDPDNPIAALATSLMDFIANTLNESHGEMAWQDAVFAAGLAVKGIVGIAHAMHAAHCEDAGTLEEAHGELAAVMTKALATEVNVERFTDAEEFRNHRIGAKRRPH